MRSLETLLELARSADPVVECLYCGADVDEALDAAPAVDDERAWAQVELVHAIGCEWVETRARRRERPDVDPAAAPVVDLPEVDCPF